MSGVGSAVGFGWDAFCGECFLEALGLVGRERGGRVVEDQEGRDAFAGGDMAGRGVVGPEFGLAAEDLAVAVFRLRFAGGLAIGRGQGDDRGDVERIGIDRDAAFEHRQRQAHGLQRTFVDGQIGGELGAGGVAHDHDTGRVAAEFSRMVMRPAERFRDIGENLVHRDRGDIAMIRRNEDIAQIGEELRLQLHGGLFAAAPAAAVDPEDDRGRLGRFGRRSVDVQRLS